MKKTDKEVFFSDLGSRYSLRHPNLTRIQTKDYLAKLFEQLLIFDRVVISTGRLNFALYFLLKELGINTVEKLIDYGYIKFMIWSPLLVSPDGRQMPDGSIDYSFIYGLPPISGGSFSKNDVDPEHNINIALKPYGLHRDRQRIFTKKALKNYIVPDGMEFSKGATDFIIDAYSKDNLSSLGLPFTKEANQLDMNERNLMIELSHQVLETSILSRYGLKSFENYEHMEICKNSLNNIGKAYNIINNTSNLFKLDDLPNLKKLYIDESLEFDSIFKLKHLSNAKNFRNWINNVGENTNFQEISKEYFNEIKGKGNFFESTKGKLLRNLVLFGLNPALGYAIEGAAGGAIGLAVKPIIDKGLDLGLGLLDDIVLDGILKGRNPSMFIDDIKKEIDSKNKLNSE